MRRTLSVLGMAAALAITSVAYAKDQPAAGKSALHFVAAVDAAFKEVLPGVSKATLWEDSGKGAYGAFTKMAPGFDSGTHMHTNDVWIVVIKGAYVYRDEAGEKRVGPGDFLRIPGGHKHWSGSDAKDGALFYEESSGAFDLVPVK